MKRILYPTDLSPSSRNAVAHGAKFCKWVGAEITIFNVRSISSMYPAEIMLPAARDPRKLSMSQAEIMEPTERLNHNAN